MSIIKVKNETFNQQKVTKVRKPERNGNSETKYNKVNILMSKLDGQWPDFSGGQPLAGNKVQLAGNKVQFKPN